MKSRQAHDNGLRQFALLENTGLAAPENSGGEAFGPPIAGLRKFA